jgi:hypothetical protein
MQFDESIIQFSIGSRTKKFHPGRLVQPGPGRDSNVEPFFGSRIILGSDPENIFGRDLDQVEVPNTNL